MSELAVKGIVTDILELVSGVSKAGKDWQKRDFAITIEGKYPKDIAFTLFGDKISLLDGVQLGDEVEVYFNLESRKYDGRYFTNVNAWKIIGEQKQKTAPEVLHETNFEKDKAEQLNVSYGKEPAGIESEDLPF